MPRTERAAPAFLVVCPGADEERWAPIIDRIVVGRDCAGVDENHRVLLDDPTASRVHFEIRLNLERNHAYIVDTSTNGTYVNGSRLGRALARPIQSGDRITVGETDFEFRSERFIGLSEEDAGSTKAHISATTMLMVVGDITNYSTISQLTDSKVVASSLQTLYGGLTSVLTKHRGTLSYYAGDALYVVWEAKHIADANELAVDFALTAHLRVTEMASDLPLRGPDGSPVGMGWAVVKGLATVVALPHSAVSAVGDATNLAFRLSGLAGRDGRAPVMVAESAREAVVDLFQWGAPESVPTKGRTGDETVYPVWGRAAPRA